MPNGTAVLFPWKRQYKMAASTQDPTNSNVESSSVRLPSLSTLTRSSSPSKIVKPLRGDIQLPLLPTATKGEKYTQLRRFDRQGLKRHKAHFRNALKTTEGIERITKQLNERLSEIGDDGKVSFERLTAASDAFEAIIKQGGAYAPILKKIKDAYHRQVMEVLREDSHPSKLEHSSPMYRLLPPTPPTTGDKLAKLRKEVHQLEIEYRVAAQQNKELQHELAEEEELLGQALAEVELPVQVQTTPPNEEDGNGESLSFVGQVERLQEQIAEKHEAIAKVAGERKCRVPLSVCHQLEQCIREVEIEIQKHQRHKHKLQEEIDNLTYQLEGIFHDHGYSNSISEILTNLGLE